MIGGPLGCMVPRKDGKPCRAAPMPGKGYCRRHSPEPVDIARHLDESRRGGERRGGEGSGPLRTAEMIAPLADDAAVVALDLNTSAGLREYVAANLRALSRLPYSVRVAHAVAQLASVQRQGIEASEIEERLAALEATEERKRLRVG